jgi:hypothetical protein
MDDKWRGMWEKFLDVFEGIQARYVTHSNLLINIQTDLQYGNHKF